jgi:hypothetical protein
MQIGLSSYDIDKLLIPLAEDIVIIIQKELKNESQ